MVLSPTILIIIGLAVAAVLVLLIVGIVVIPRTASGDVQSRLEEYASRSTPVSLEELEMSLSFSDRVLVPFFQNLARSLAQLTPQQSREKARRNLELAGRPVKSPEIFLGIKFGVAAALVVLAFLLLSITGQPLLNKLLFSAIGGVIGYILPGVWLGSKISQRQDEVIKALPDALDLLVICVEAGLGFEGAMAKVAEKWDNELSRAFARVLQEIRLGKLRIEALREMDKNLGVAEVTSFVAAIIQATQFGVSIAKVLRIQAEQMRIQRRQRAEKKAQEAPIKMLFPMVFLIFPSLFIVLLGPAVLQILDSGVFGSVF